MLLRIFKLHIEQFTGSSHRGGACSPASVAILPFARPPDMCVRQCNADRARQATAIAVRFLPRLAQSHESMAEQHGDS